MLDIVLSKTYIKRKFKTSEIEFIYLLVSNSSSGILDDMEYACYCQMFDHMTQQNPPQLDLIGTLVVFN